MWRTDKVEQTETGPERAQLAAEQLQLGSVGVSPRQRPEGDRASGPLLDPPPLEPVSIG